MLIATCTSFVVSPFRPTDPGSQQQGILRHNRGRLPCLEHYFQHAARDPQSSLTRLVAIRDARHRNGLALPTGPVQLPPQQSSRIVLDENLRLEIQTGTHPQLLVSRTCVAVHATMLATAIWIDAVMKWNVGAVVTGNDGLRPIGQELCFDRETLRRFFLPPRELFCVRFDVSRLIAIGRIEASASSHRSAVWCLVCWHHHPFWQPMGWSPSDRLGYLSYSPPAAHSV